MLGCSWCQPGSIAHSSSSCRWAPWGGWLDKGSRTTPGAAARIQAREPLGQTSLRDPSGLQIFTGTGGLLPGHLPPRVQSTLQSGADKAPPFSDGCSFAFLTASLDQPRLPCSMAFCAQPCPVLFRPSAHNSGRGVQVLDSTSFSCLSLGVDSPPPPHHGQ